MSSPVLSVDSTAIRLPGTKLQWVSTDATFGSQYLLLNTKDIEPSQYSRIDLDKSETDHTLLELTNGVSYLATLVQELDDGSNKVSNTLTIVGQHIPSAPMIHDVIGLDEKMKVLIGYNNQSIVPSVTSITFIVSDGEQIFTDERPVTDYLPTQFILDTNSNPLIQNDKTFEIACFVTNAKGDSPLSVAVKGMPCNYPNAPSGLSSIPSSNQVLLSWLHPNDYSQYSTNSTVLKAVVSYKQSSASEWLSKEKSLLQSSGPSMIIDELTDGANYDFKLHYVNDCGDGLESDVIVSRPFSPPLAPVIVSTDSFSESYDAQVTIQWSAPSTLESNYAIQSYEITDTGFTYIHTDLSTLERTLTDDLEVGFPKTYYLKAQIFNTETQTLVSGQSISVSAIPYTRARNFLNLNAIGNGNSGELQIDWVGPADDSGFPIQHYELTIEGVKVNVGLASSYLASGLTNFSEIFVTIRAVTFNTERQIEVPGVEETFSGYPYLIPPPPVFVTLDESKDSSDAYLELSWSDPENYHTPDGYEMGDGTNVSAPYFPDEPVSHRISGLVNGQVYTLKVRSFKYIQNVKRYSPYLEVQGSPYTKPSDVRNAFAAQYDSKLVINFQEPLDNGGRPVEHYLVTLRDTSQPEAMSSVVVNQDEQKSATFLGLQNGQEYEFNIKVKTSGYDSPTGPGVSGFGVPFKISLPVENLVAQPMDQSGMLSWDLPSDTGGFEILSLNVRINGGSAVTLSESATQYNVIGLQNGLTATVEVSVSTIHGESQRRSVNFIPFSDPIIESVTVVNDKMLSISVSPNGRRITKWAVFAHDSSPSQPEELFLQSTESNTSIVGNFTINASFSSFDLPISKWVAVVMGEGGSAVASNI